MLVLCEFVFRKKLSCASVTSATYTGGVECVKEVPMKQAIELSREAMGGVDGALVEGFLVNWSH